MNKTKRDEQAAALARAYRRESERSRARSAVRERARMIAEVNAEHAAQARVVAARDAWIAAGRPNIDHYAVVAWAGSKEVESVPAA